MRRIIREGDCRVCTAGAALRFAIEVPIAGELEEEITKTTDVVVMVDIHCILPQH